MTVAEFAHIERGLNEENRHALPEIVSQLVAEYERDQFRNKVKRRSLLASEEKETRQSRPSEIQKIPRAELEAKMKKLALIAFSHSKELPSLVKQHGLVVVHLIAKHGAVASVVIKRHGADGIKACKERGVSGALELIHSTTN